MYQELECIFLLVAYMVSAQESKVSKDKNGLEFAAADWAATFDRWRGSMLITVK